MLLLYGSFNSKKQQCPYSLSKGIFLHKLDFFFRELTYQESKE